MVLTETVKALGKIGIGDEDTMAIITRVVTRFHNLNPDNLLVLSALEAFDKLGQANNGRLDNSVLELIIKIYDGPYLQPVKLRAQQLLADLRKYAVSGQDN
jgi:hypothetical protein